VLFGNSSILIVQLAVLGVGGLGFWVIAAGKFDVSTLGTASVLVALTAFVIYATTLGLPVTVGRFGAGTSDVDRAVFSWSMVTTLVSSAVGAGVVSLLAAGGWFP
jgi:O-antigen/teichoic acid export membrane protein